MTLAPWLGLIARRSPRNWLLALFCLLASAAPVKAAERERPTALIRVETADDSALVERVRGQVSDLSTASTLRMACAAFPTG